MPTSYKVVTDMDDDKLPSTHANATLPTVIDPVVASKLLLLEAQYLQLAVLCAMPVVEPTPGIRDLSPLGR